ncbi:MAG: ATP-binding protein [Sporichthyaceae bacterium]
MEVLSTDAYLPRLVDRVLGRQLAVFPAVMVRGARACGKTTTAARQASTVLRLDDPLRAEAYRADPDGNLARLSEPILIDEWQRVPEVLGAVKRAVDALGSGPGRFLVSGSVRDDLLADSWPATGRLIGVEMSGLTVREIQRGDLSAAPFLERLAAGSLADPPNPPSLGQYVEWALAGGFPEPVLTLSSETSRRQWSSAYLDRVFTRDVADVDVPRDPGRLARYFEAYALNTAGQVLDTTLIEAAGINRGTALAYERLLTAVMLVEALPAWSSNRVKRLVRSPKRYVRDTGLAAAAMGASIDDVLGNGDVLGRIVDSFAVAQLRAEQALFDRPPRLYHLRDEGGRHEVDLVAELGFKRVVAIEIKAGGAVNAGDARHLAWLRDQLGEEFVAGVVLHTGPHVYPLGDRILAAPIATMWA